MVLANRTASSWNPWQQMPRNSGSRKDNNIYMWVCVSCGLPLPYLSQHKDDICVETGKLVFIAFCCC